ncbi:MAG: hypothetical protein OMM_06595 [Candidatus Magnetoglobus multicellularis str. Araruama]|uniref:N-acetyltransferase domain-containing protein n=1 Tax=Candidatus Magnetoglobus multicellularis str. Araruama TaxID=890399 RepID=A0A1V1PGH7_9BACT|nr:MAG: hypothetical protein OMM_06595 [Candidatus Magnetoglobus multicellularis str. Araruama]
MFVAFLDHNAIYIFNMKTHFHIYEKSLQSLSKDEKEALQHLTISEDSYMAFVLNQNPSKAKCWIIGIENDQADNQNIVAWSLLRWYTPDIRSVNCAYISLFVHPKFRKQGLGKRLISKTMAYAENNQLTVIVYGHTAKQHAFYKACGVNPLHITHHAFPKTYWDHYKFVKNLLDIQ